MERSESSSNRLVQSESQIEVSRQGQSHTAEQTRARRTSDVGQQSIAPQNPVARFASSIKASIMNRLKPSAEKSAEKTTLVAFKKMGPMAFIKKAVLNRVLAGKYKQGSEMSGTTKWVVTNFLKDRLDSIDQHQTLIKRNPQRKDEYMGIIASELKDYERVRLSLATFKGNNVVNHPQVFRARANPTEKTDSNILLNERNIALRDPENEDGDIKNSLQSTEESPIKEEVKFEEFMTRAEANESDSDSMELIDEAIELKVALDQEEDSLSKTERQGRLDGPLRKLKQTALTFNKKEGPEFFNVIDQNKKSVEEMKPKDRQTFERILTKRLAIIKHAKMTSYTNTDIAQGDTDIAQGDLEKMRNHPLYEPVMASQRKNPTNRLIAEHAKNELLRASSEPNEPAALPPPLRARSSTPPSVPPRSSTPLPLRPRSFTPPSKASTVAPMPRTARAPSRVDGVVTPPVTVPRGARKFDTGEALLGAMKASADDMNQYNGSTIYWTNKHGKRVKFVMTGYDTENNIFEGSWMFFAKDLPKGEVMIVSTHPIINSGTQSNGKQQLP